MNKEEIDKNINEWYDNHPEIVQRISENTKPLPKIDITSEQLLLDIQALAEKTEKAFAALKK